MMISTRDWWHSQVEMGHPEGVVIPPQVEAVAAAHAADAGVSRPPWRNGGLEAVLQNR